MIETKKSIAVILDAMSTARHYADVLRKHNIECAHIQSSTEMHPRFHREFISTNFVNNTLATDEVGLQKLRDKFEILCVLPGQDPIAPMADQLAQTLNAKHRNSDKTSSNRVDKHEMIRAIGAAGLRAPECTQIKSIEDLEKSVRNSKFPLVAKPPKSAGVDLVSICHDVSELKHAVNDILTTQNVYGATNECAVIQSFVYGQEYMIDTVSMNGEHHLISVWKMHRANSRTPYPLFAETVGRSSPEAEIAYAYVKQVLDATGHRFGPAHCEIKIDQDAPTIIEINPRLHGSLDVYAVEEASDASQISCLAKLLNGEDFIRPREHQDTVLKAYFLSPIDTKLEADIQLEDFRKIPGFYSLDVNFTKGREIKKTTTLTTAAGYIYFKTKTSLQARSAYSQFRQIENEMWAKLSTGQSTQQHAGQEVL